MSLLFNFYVSKKICLNYKIFDDTFLNSNSSEFLENLLSVLRGELKYLLKVIDKVAIETRIPKKPIIKIGELGKSYTGMFI